MIGKQANFWWDESYLHAGLLIFHLEASSTSASIDLEAFGAGYFLKVKLLLRASF